MKLLMLKGLPASGKSTYAKELVAQGWKRINKDDLRSMLDDNKWSKGNEAIILALRNNLLDILLSKYNVVVDDTNFAPNHEEVLRSYATMKSAEFEVKFFDTPLLECIERDAKRGDKSVGREVIERMYTQYLKPKPVPYNNELIDVYLCDLDGSLAHMKGRSAYEWDRVGEDSLDENVAHVIDALKFSGRKVFIVSGRDSVCKDETIKWLDENGIIYDEIFMRPLGDKRPDTEIKKEIYKNNIKGKYNVLGVFDDRDSVVQLWRSLGLKCYQCDYGNF